MTRFDPAPLRPKDKHRDRAVDRASTLAINVIVTVFGIWFSFLVAYPLMIGLGVLHNPFPIIPALSYIETAFAYLLWAVLMRPYIARRIEV
jgi:hypothetical protein